MKLGKIKLNLFFIILIFSTNYALSEDKILTTPLINLENLEPSFEEINDVKNDKINNIKIKNKKNILLNNTSSSAKFIGLDKITAKTSEIILNLGETKKFGSLEIKVLKCGKINLENSKDNVAYLQVKDISKNENEKVFIFNGWTFSSDPALTPFDHAIYDLQLVNCNKV